MKKYLMNTNFCKDHEKKAIKKAKKINAKHITCLSEIYQEMENSEKVVLNQKDDHLIINVF